MRLIIPNWTALAAAAEAVPLAGESDELRVPATGRHAQAAVRAYCRASGQPEPETPVEASSCAARWESLAALYARLMEQLETVTGQQLHTLHICLAEAAKMRCSTR